MISTYVLTYILPPPPKKKLQLLHQTQYLLKFLVGSDFQYKILNCTNVILKSAWTTRFLM
jgi:hypothetical protein